MEFERRPLKYQELARIHGPEHGLLGCPVMGEASGKGYYKANPSTSNASVFRCMGEDGVWGRVRPQ